MTTRSVVIFSCPPNRFAIWGLRKSSSIPLMGLRPCAYTGQTLIARLAGDVLGRKPPVSRPESAKPKRAGGLGTNAANTQKNLQHSAVPNGAQWHQNDTPCGVNNLQP